MSFLQVISAAAKCTGRNTFQHVKTKRKFGLCLGVTALGRGKEGRKNYIQHQLLRLKAEGWAAGGGPTLGTTHVGVWGIPQPLPGDHVQFTFVNDENTINGVVAFAASTQVNCNGELSETEMTKPLWSLAAATLCNHVTPDVTEHAQI